MKTVKVKLAGNEVLMNAFWDTSSLPGSTKGEGASTVKVDASTPREMAERAAYRYPEDAGDLAGILYAPTTWIFGTIRNAGVYHKHRNKQVSTRDRSMVGGAVTFSDAYIPFRRNGSLIKDFEVFSCVAVNQVKKAAIMTHRPKIDNWELAFTIEIDEEVLPIAMVRELFDTAGKMIGIGSFRVMNNGIFGKFKVNHWEVER